MADAFTVPAYWYDGQSALRRQGKASWNGEDRLTLEAQKGEAAPDHTPLHISLANLVFTEDRRAETVYHRKDEPDFRLILPKELPSGLSKRLPAKHKYGAWIDRIGFGRAAAGFAIVSAASVALFVTAPEWLGPMVPQSWERRLGDAMVGDLGNRLCSTPEGDAALAKMLGKVDPSGQQVRAGVANVDMVNAVALPGGQVLLFDGLVQEAESPEELAGVLAHEVGHVRERHVMTALLRQFGLSVLISGINSNVGSGALAATRLSYGREAEREADRYARNAMRDADISPVGAAEFFERQLGDSGERNSASKAVEWLSTHPLQAERARAFRDSAAQGRNYPPALTDEEYAALKSMCKDDPDVEEFDVF